MVDILPAYERRVRPSVNPGPHATLNQFRTASDSLPLAQIGQAANQLGGTLAQQEIERTARATREEQDRLERERKVKLAATRNEARQRNTLGLLDDFATAKQGAAPGADGFYEGFQKTVQKRRESELASIPPDDVETRLAIEQDFDRIALPVLVDAQEFQATEGVRYRADLLDGSLNAMGNAIVASPDRFDDFYHQGLASIEDASEDLSPEGRRKMLEEWKSSASMAAFNGMLEADPYQALEDAKSKRFDALWSPETKARAINAAQAEVKRRAAEARALETSHADFRVADLELAVRRGELGHLDIADAREEGLFDSKPQKFTQLMGIADDVHEKKVLVAEQASALQGKLAAGLGLDSQEEADKVWDARVKLIPEDADEGETLAHVAQFARDTGFVPSDAKRIIKNADRMQSSEHLAAAAQMYTVVQDVAPGVDSGVGDRVRLVKSLVDDAGMDYDEAATQVVALLPDAATSKVRKEELKDLKVNFDEQVANRFEDMEGFFGDNRTTIGITSEYERRFKALYELSGNQEMALSAAAKQMKETWGVSAFNNGMAMRLPPERYRPSAAANLDADQYKEIVSAEIEDALRNVFDVSVGARPEPEPKSASERAEWLRRRYRVGNFDESDDRADDLPPYRLEADQVMSKASMARGGGPLYRVMVENDFGAMIPLADQNGDLVLYSLPGTQEVLASDVFKKAVEDSKKDLADQRRAIEGMENSLTLSPMGDARLRNLGR